MRALVICKNKCFSEFMLWNFHSLMTNSFVERIVGSYFCASGL